MASKRKVVFLDIDGVLQSLSTQNRFDHDLEALTRELAARFHNDEYVTMDRYDLGAIVYDWVPAAVERLRRLIRDSGAEVVISSSWRSYNTLPRLKQYFKIHELDQYITGETPQRSYHRWREITEYLDAHPEVAEFVILDDAQASDFQEHFPKNFVHCQRIFDHEAYQKARVILGLEREQVSEDDPIARNRHC